uniref:Reticulon-like protein n=1 Tax=Strigamia maritima TaxID=126957 RepID=T1J6M0_STRMM
MGDIDNDFMNFGKPENKNTGSHESDDFEQVDEDQPEDDDFLITSTNSEFVRNNSTDRPLVTLEEMVPSAPPAPPGPLSVSDTIKFDEDSEPEYELQYSQPPAPKKETKKKNFEEPEVVASDLSPFDTLKSDFTLDNLDPCMAVCPPKPPTPEVEEIVRESPEMPKKEVELSKDVSSSSSKCSCPFSAWFNPQYLDPRVVDLVYWRDPKKSGLVFAGILIILLSLSYFSLISVLAYVTLAVLAGTLSFRIYKNVLAAVQKSNEGHPFKKYLEQDMVISGDQIQDVTQSVVVHTNAVAHELRRLILVEDLIDSIKFGVVLWCLTYVGAWFNGMTLLILGFVAAFTLPKVYETNKTQIDHYINIARTQVDEIMSKIKSKVPIGKKAKEHLRHPQSLPLLN